MTTEEKAKAYDRAVKQAEKEILACGSLNCDTARQIFRLFPQLRESEDERIRKALIDALKVSETIGELKFRLPYPTREECIAYLEKQEQNIVVYDGDNYESAKEKAWNNFSGKTPLIPEAKSIHDNGFRGGYQFGIHEEKPLKWTVHDEAVRKEAIACLEEWKHLIPCSSIEDYDNILNWLKEELSIHTEKQEQKPVNHNLTTWHRDVVYSAMCDKNLDEGLRCNLEVVYKTIKELVDRTSVVEEQKPVEYLDKDKVYAIMTKLTNLSYSTRIPINSDEYKKIGEITSDVRSLLDYPIEQKPAWGEEDEETRKDILAILEQFGRGLAMTTRERRDKMVSWMRNLRPSWKPSELEKGALRTAIHILTDERSFPKAAEQLQNILDAFEGKESRKDWKPTEEQIKILNWAANGMVDKCIAAPEMRAVLRELYEQLKKL